MSGSHRCDEGPAGEPESPPFFLGAFLLYGRFGLPGHGSLVVPFLPPYCGFCPLYRRHVAGTATQVDKYTACFRYCLKIVLQPQPILLLRKDPRRAWNGRLHCCRGENILMPLIQKPRDPSYGVRKVRRKPNKRKLVFFRLLPETKEYLDARSATIARGRLIDEAIKLHAEHRHELSAALARKPVKRVKFGTSVSQETVSYIQLMRNEISPGKLIDEAIRLYRQVNQPDR